jgi:trans-2-enoyl-CoA reductase
MKIAQYKDHGDPSSVIKIIDISVRPPSIGEVVIKMEAAPVHLADLYCMLGKEKFVSPLPATPGFEGIGRIVEVGSGVTDWFVGDRVFPPLASGTWCELLTTSTDGLLAAPSGDAVQLSLLPINPPTSYLILEDYAKLDEGEWIIQNAANSNCGRYLIELAKLRGLRTINLVRRPELIQELEALGGDVVLEDGANLAERVLNKTGGVRPKLAIDAVNGMATERLASCLADGSKILAYGMLTDEPCMLSAGEVFLRDISLEGFYTIRQFAKRSSAEVRQIYSELAYLFAEGSLTAQIAATYPLTEVKKAVEHAGLRGAEREGKVILVMQ